MHYPISSVSPTALFLPPDPHRTLSPDASVAPLGQAASQAFLVVMTLGAESQVICRVVLGWDWPGVFSWLDWALARRTGEGKCLSHDTRVSRTRASGLTHSVIWVMRPWLRWCPSGVSTIKPPPSSLPPVPLERGDDLQPTPKPWDPHAILLRAGYLRMLFDIPPPWRFFSSLSFIILVSHVFIFLSTHGQLFHT